MFFMANRLNRLFQSILDVTGGNGTNSHIWKQKLSSRGDISYLGDSDIAPHLGENSYPDAATEFTRLIDYFVGRQLRILIINLF